MDSEYLKINVGDVLAQGISRVILANPDDDIDYLAKWLLKYAADQKSEKKSQDQQAQWDKEHAALQAQDAEKERTRLADQKQYDDSKSRDSKFLSELSSLDDLDELLARWCDFTRMRLDATGVYISQLDQTEPDTVDTNAPDETDDDFVAVGAGDDDEDEEEHDDEDDEEDDDAEVSTIECFKYRAASKDHEWMLEEMLLPGKGLSWKLYKNFVVDDDGNEVEAEESEDESDHDDDEYDSDGNVVPRDKPAPERKRIFVPNVLLGKHQDTIHFYRLPKNGAFYTVSAGYESLLHEEALNAPLAEENDQDDDESAAAAAVSDRGSDDDSSSSETDDEDKASADEEEETDAEESQEKAVIAPPPTVPIKLAVGVDTLGQVSSLSQSQRSWLERMVEALERELARADAALFLAERRQRREMTSHADEATDVLEGLTLEDREDQLDKLREEFGDDIAAEDLSFRRRQAVVVSLRAVIQEFRSYKVFRGPLKVLQAIFYMLGFTQDQVANKNNQPEWRKCRMLFNDDLFRRLSSYDPSVEQKRSAKQAYARVKNLKKLLKGHSEESLRPVNKPLAELFGYATDALTMKEAAAKRRKQDRLEREAEELAAAKAAESERLEAEADKAAEDASGSEHSSDDESEED